MGITKAPGSNGSPSLVNLGSKKPCFSHQSAHAASTTLGWYAEYWGASRGPRTTGRDRSPCQCGYLVGCRVEQSIATFLLALGCRVDIHGLCFFGSLLSRVRLLL